MSDHRLTYGALDFDGSGPYSAYADGFDLGAPVPLVTALPRLLLDGEVVSGSRSSNREITFVVGISGSDGISLAEAEAALVLEVNKARNTLAWAPPNLGPTNVYDTFRGTLRNRFSDLDEMRGERFYELTLPALPFAHSVEPVNVPVVLSGGTPTTVVVDSCDSVTGWSGAGLAVSSSAFVTAPSSLRISQAAKGTQSHPYKATFTRTGVIDMTGTPYLSIQTKYITGWSTARQTVRMWADGVELPRVGVENSPVVAGWDRWQFVCSAASVSSLVIEVSGSFTDPDEFPFPSIHIDDLVRSNQIAQSASGKQSLRSCAVLGSVRAPVSIAVEHETTVLGDVLVYTSDDLGDGYRPDLRRWRVSGTTPVADAQAISGVGDPVTFTDSVFEVPTRMLRPSAYAVMGRVKAEAPGMMTLNVSAQTVVGSALADTVTASSRTALTTLYSIVPLGVLHLPPTSVTAATDGKVKVSFANLTSSTVVTLDEMWLFDLDGGVLTHVNAPGGALAFQRLWIEPPSVDQPRGGVWIGKNADRSDARSAGVNMRSLGRHIFAPPQAFAYVVTPNVANPSVSLSYFPHAHTNVA